MDAMVKTKQGRAKPVEAKPDMKAWAGRVQARLKKQYGGRVTPDSAPLFEDMRMDKA